jgi:hypothetical protein
MLSGCPDCGGNTFQFLPEGAIPDGELDDAVAPGATDTDTDTGAETAPADVGGAPSASGRVPVESAESTTSADTDDTDDADEEPVAPPEPPRKPPPSRGRLERATDAVRSFVFDSPTSTPRSTAPDRASDSGENAADATRDPDPDDATEPISGSTRNGGDPPGERSSPPDASAGVDDSSASAVDSGDGGSEADPSAGTDSGGRIGPDDWADPAGRTDPDTAAGSEEAFAAGATNTADAGAENHTPTAAQEDAAGTDESRSTTPDPASADAADARTPPESAEDGRIAAEPSENRPDLEELRRELNDQFESIKIVEPGQYELNLMELYNREEYIIALREDGRYAIEAPETWLGRRADRE